MPLRIHGGKRTGEHADLSAHPAATQQIDLAILTSFEAPLPLVSQALRVLQRTVDAQSSEHKRYSVSIEMFHAGRLREKRGLLDANHYHGVIITNTLPDDDQFLASARPPYAVVLVGRSIANYCCVLETPNFVGRRAAKVMVEARCVQPAILHGCLLTQATTNRRAAFISAVRERLGREPTSLVAAGLHPSQGAAVIEAFFRGGGKCDGIFAVTDSLAVGAYQAIRRVGLRIPADVAVVGVGDYELAEFFDPPLSTVAGANDDMVAKAVPRLFQLLRGENVAPNEVLVVPPVFLRESTRR